MPIASRSAPPEALARKDFPPDSRGSLTPGSALVAGRRDRQVLGKGWAAGAGRLVNPGRRCQRSLPNMPHQRASLAVATCPHSWFCSPRAEMGTNLPAVDLGAGRTALAVSAGYLHTCALLVRYLRVGNCRMGQPGPTTRAPRCRTSASATRTRLSPSLTCVPNTVLSACRRMTRPSSAGA